MNNSQSMENQESIFGMKESNDSQYAKCSRQVIGSENETSALCFLKNGSGATAPLKARANEQVYQGKTSILDKWQEKYPVSLYDPFTHHHLHKTEDEAAAQKQTHLQPALPKHDRRSSKQEKQQQLELMAKTSSHRRFLQQGSSKKGLDVIAEYQQEDAS